MERIILETVFILNLIFLIFLYIKLFRKVIYFRGKYKIALGSGKKIELERAIRAHSNFNENVPIGLILLMFLYFHNLLIFSCISILLLSLGRLFHSQGILDVNEGKTSYDLRRKGMKLTIYSYKSALFGLLFYIGQVVYFYISNIY